SRSCWDSSDKALMKPEKKKSPQKSSASGKKSSSNAGKVSKAASIPSGKALAKSSAKPKSVRLKKAAPAKEPIAEVKSAAKNVLRATKEVVKAAAKTPIVKKVKRAVRKTALKIPAILLEGDAPVAP